LSSCTTAPTSPTELDINGPGLTATLRAPNQIPTKGLTQLDLGGDRDGFLYVPENYSPGRAMPMLVALHGAGGSSSYWNSYRYRAEERDMIVLAIDSRLRTWDLILGGYGDDLQFLDQALNYVFLRCNIDQENIALCGFSDGATYALSLGISNGDLFSHIIGYSPGYVVVLGPLVGKPKIYISHGTDDTIIPVEGSRDDIVHTFINHGYDVTYNEFDGGHQVPYTISEAALDWFLGPIIDP
jgi:phospholipase/carboxylesterase